MIKLRSVLSSLNQLFAFTIAVMLFTGGVAAGNVVYANGILEEITVTAQKREQSVFDVPISIVAIGGDELDARRISNFEDLGLAVPGLSVEDSGFARRIFMRGLSNGTGASPLIGIYLDEVSVTGGHAVYQIDSRTFDLERVEILRGPQGTLYGQGSMGGTIRFITKNPQLDRFTTKADVAASFTENGAPGQKITGVVNVPLVENELGLRIAGMFEHAGGWIDQPAASRDDINDYNLANVRVKGLWQPTEALQVNAMAVVHRNDTATSTGEDDDGNYTQFLDQLTSPSIEDDYEIYNLTLTYDFDAFRFLNATSYVNADKELREIGNSCCGGVFHIMYPLFLTGNNTFSEELRLSSIGFGSWQWTVGGFYQKSDAFVNGAFRFAAPSGGALPPAFPFTQEPSSESWAIFGNTSFALTERLEIGAGLRYFEDDREFFDGTTTQKGTFNSLNPRGYVNFEVTENVKAYASAAKGFRSGGFNLLNQPTYDPEEVWTYELGTKMSLLEGLLDAEVAIFYSDYTNFQIGGILPPPAAPVNIISNAGDVEIKGVDWSLTWHASDNLSLGLNGNYVDAEFVKINLISSSVAVGDSLSAIPKYSYTLMVNYDFTWGRKPSFARLDYNQRGRTLSNSGTSSDVINMLNFNFGWEWSDNLSFGVFVQNLLDERDFIGTNSGDLAAARPRPRTMGIEIGVEFD